MSRSAVALDELPTTLLELDVGPVAHGGHCVARHEGRVVFVRHTLPGERVRALLTTAGADDKFWRADAVDVLRASPDRVPSPWPEAGPGGVGGGELAHVSLAAGRVWKAAVVAEQLRRLAGLDLDVSVEAAPGDDERDGLAWRTRIELVADPFGRAGMHRHRSHTVLALDAMPLASPQIQQLDLFGRAWPPGARVEVVAPVGAPQPVVLVDGVPDGGAPGRVWVHEVVEVDGREYRYRVAADGFWQVHREAPAMLVRAVLDALRGTVGDGGTVLDLYAGAGLFSRPLADLVGSSGTVLAVEGDAGAVRDARRNARTHPQVELHSGDVARVLAGSPVRTADAVVLDPPRAGAGRRVVAQVAALRPRAVVYVACDPAALARDVRFFADHSYRLRSLRALDLYPMTHHVECVAVLTGQDGEDG